MKSLITIFLLFYINFSWGQDRVTHINNEGNGSRIVLLAVDSVNYVCAITADDTVHVYTEESDNLTFLHKRKIKSAYNSWRYIFHSSFLLGDNDDGSYMYNVVNDSLVEFVFINEFNQSNFTILNEDEVIMSHSSNLDDEQHLINIKESRIDTFNSGIYVVSSTESHLLFFDKRNNRTDYHIVDRLTLDTVFSYDTYLPNKKYILDDRNFIFEKGEFVLSFNLESEEIDTIFFDEFVESTNKEIIKVDSFYLILTRETENRLHIYNTASEFIKELKFDEHLINFHPDIIQGNLLVSSTDGSFSIDTYDFEVIKYNSDFRWSYQRSVVDSRFVYSKYEHRIHQIDLLEKTEYLLPEEIGVDDFLEVTAIRSGSNVLINFDDKEEDYQSLYKINSLSVQTSDLLSSFNSGISIESELFQIGDKVVLVDQNDIYTIEGLDVTQLNLYPAKRIKTTGNFSTDGTQKIVWLEVYGNEIYAKCISKEGFKKYGPFNGLNIVDEIEDYCITNSTLYYRLSDFTSERLFAINENSNLAVPVDGINEYGWVKMYAKGSSLLVYYGGELYYKNSEILGGLTNLNIPQFVLEPIIFKEKLYFVSEKGLYLIENGAAVLVVDENINNSNYLSSGNFLIKMLQERDFVSYDGLQYEKYDLDYPLYWFRLIDSNNLILNNYYFPEAPMLRFDIINSQFHEIGGDLAEKNIISKFSLGSRIILAVTDEIISPSTLFLYETDEVLEEFELVGEIPFTGNGNSFSWISNDPNILVYSSENLFQITPSLELENIDFLKGDNQLAKFVEDENNIYFTAIADSVGRQVFRIQKTTTSTINSESLLSELVVYPNPSSSDISFSENCKGLTFELVFLSGEVVESGVIDYTNIITTSHIPTGIYVLRIFNDQGVVSRKVVVDK